MRAVVLVFSLLLICSSVACSRQVHLGPKDGAGLPPRDLNRIQVGQPAPDFTLEDAAGRPLTLSDFRGKYVILVFYRGHW
jgi:cytochrome oxidase Cu insertion factor (SCO1/SenC/PrrC family)